MNAQEIIAKVSKYKEMLEAESDSDIRARYQKKIKELEASLEEVEKKVEKLEEKVATEEKKELSEAEKKIRKYQDFLDNESDPDLKARYQKKIKELQDSLKEVKEEIKEEKKEVAEQKAEIKKAAKVVKAAKATKVERKEAVKKVEKKVRERKEVSVKRTRRGKKIKEIIDELDKLIAKNKKLKEKYTGKGVDVKRDAGRSAKPFGYRFVGKHDYRVPTADQIKKGKKRGTIDYEGRPNRSDVYPKRAAKLAKGGYVTDLDEVVASSDLKDKLKSKMKEGDEIVAFGYTDYGGSFGDKVAIEYFKKNHPKNIVFENSGYNGQNGIVFGEVAKDFLEETKDYPLGYEDMESFYFDMQNAQEEKDFKRFLSDIKSNSYNKITGHQYTIKKEALDWLLENKSGYYSIEPNGIDFSYKELANELEKEGLIKRKMADGGMMDGKTQGYDDKEDERLGMEDGKLASKDFIGSRKHRKHSRRDDAQFEERGKMAKGGRVGHSKEDKARFAKPAGWRWKEIAVTKRIIERKQLSMQPSKKMRDKYPDYVYYEDRLNKADKKPSRKYLSE
jgi:hypothetical protein